MATLDHSESNSSSEEEFSNFYSGAAKRFKLEKQAVFQPGIVQLVKKPDGKHSKSSLNSSPAPVTQVDSSDEEIYRDVDTECDGKDNGLNETDVVGHGKQVETLEDVEEYINICPDSPVNIVEERTHSSSTSIHLIDENDVEEDPLYCAPLNDSDLNQPLDDDEKVVVKVRFLEQKVWRIELKRVDYFKTICQKLSEDTNIDMGKITLYFNNQILDHYDNLKTIPIKISDIIDATVCSEAVISTNENMLEFKIQSQNRNSQVIVSIRAEDPMKVLMQKYAEATGNELSKLTFKFDGENLEEDDTPSSLELEGGECIDVFINE